MMNAPPKNLALWAAVVTLAAVAIGANFLVRERPERPVDLAQGRHLYAVHCASCHGANLEGQPNWQTRRPDGRMPAPPHDASGHTWHHSDGMLFAITKDGVGKFAPAGYESDMPGFKGVLTDEEIRAVLGYIKSRWPAEIQARHATLK